MKVEFKPKNNLEYAIQTRNAKQVIYAIADGEEVTDLLPVSHLGDECFSDEVVLAVFFTGMDEKQLKQMTSCWFWEELNAGERLRALLNEAFEPLPQEPEDDEVKLFRAVFFHRSDEVIRLIREEKVVFRGFSAELLTRLPKLSKEAVLTLLRDGLSPVLKAVVFGLLLNEAEHPEKLKKLSRHELLRYANLMIQILAGNPVSAEEAWYPDTE